jgi:SUKH-4 immunity protein
VAAITPDDFRRAWTEHGDGLVAYSKIALAGVPIPDDARQFLARVGLPDQAAPFLTFRAPISGPLQSAATMFGLNSRLDDRFVIGSNGSGDPIVVSIDGVVSSLNHDANFGTCYINASISLLASTLLQFRGLVSLVERAIGPDANLDGIVSLAIQDDLKSFLQIQDPAALEAGAFWNDEISDWSKPA